MKITGNEFDANAKACLLRITERNGEPILPSGEGRLTAVRVNPGDAGESRKKRSEVRMACLREDLGRARTSVTKYPACRWLPHGIRRRCLRPHCSAPSLPHRREDKLRK